MHVRRAADGPMHANHSASASFLYFPSCTIDSIACHFRLSCAIDSVALISLPVAADSQREYGIAYSCTPTLFSSSSALSTPALSSKELSPFSTTLTRFTFSQLSFLVAGSIKSTDGCLSANWAGSCVVWRKIVVDQGRLTAEQEVC